MHVIALMNHPAVIARIPSSLGLLQPPPGCGPSPPATRASLPLACPPDPDIA
jgi:hypothetical protein